MSRVSFRDLLLIGAIGLFWGLNWPAVKTILTELPPWTLRAAGFTGGAVLLFAIARARGEVVVPARREYAQIALAGFLTVFAFNALTAFGQLLTETSKAAIVAFTMPVWAAVMAAVFLRERLTVARIAALGLGMVALATLVSEDWAAFLARPAGLLLMLGSAIAWAAGTVYLKAVDWRLGLVARAAWMVALSAPPVIVLSLAFDRPWTLSFPSPLVLWTLAYHIVFPMAFCYVAWVTLVGRLPATVAAIATLLIPVVGVGSAVVLLGDPPTWQKAVALVLVLASVVLTMQAGRGRQS